MREPLHSRALLRRAGLDPDPLAQFRRWYADAQQSASMAEAVTLATATPDGRPSARLVLLRSASGDGLDFYTNRHSRKGRELEANPHAALTFFWVELSRQVRVEGPVAPVPDAESDAYFSARPRDSQLGAWASDQSEPLADREALDRSYAEVERRFEGAEVPRPPHWGGYRLEPRAWEFWQGQSGRLHDRFLYTPDDAGGWRIERLAP